MLYSGVDLHRRLIVICTVNESGSIVARKSMKTQPDLVTAYFRQWPDQHRAVVECTTGWYWFADLLQSLGVDVVLAHAKYLKAISYAKVKTMPSMLSRWHSCSGWVTFPRLINYRRNIERCVISCDNGW